MWRVDSPDVKALALNEHADLQAIPEKKIEHSILCVIELRKTENSACRAEESIVAATRLGIVEKRIKGG